MGRGARGAVFGVLQISTGGRGRVHRGRKYREGKLSLRGRISMNGTMLLRIWGTDEGSCRYGSRGDGFYMSSVCVSGDRRFLVA